MKWSADDGRPAQPGHGRHRAGTSLDGGHRSGGPALSPPAEVALLLEVTGARRGDVQRLQPHLSPPALRRPGRRVLGAARGRHPLGRRRRAPDRDHRAGRLRVHQHARAPRPDEVRRRAVQVRVHHRPGRRDHQRPGPAARRVRPVLALARRLRRRAVGDGAGPRRRLGRVRPGDRRRSGAGPGPEGQGPRHRPLRGRRRRDALLPPAPRRAGRHGGRHQPHRLQRGDRVRDLPAPRHPRRGEAVGPGVGGGPAARPAPDRSVPHPAHRGRHARLRLRHHPRHQPARGRLRLHVDGRPRPGGRLRRQGRPDPGQAAGPGPLAGRCGDRRGAAGHVQRRLDDRAVHACGTARAPWSGR